METNTGMIFWEYICIRLYEIIFSASNSFMYVFNMYVMRLHVKRLQSIRQRQQIDFTLHALPYNTQLSRKCCRFDKKDFFSIILLHAHVQYVCNASAKDQIASTNSMHYIDSCRSNFSRISQGNDS